MGDKQTIIQRRFYVAENISTLPTYTWFKANGKIYYFRNKEAQLQRLTDSNHLEAVFQPEIDAINASKQIEVLEPVEFVFEQKIIR